MNEKLTQADLLQFTGTENYYRHSFMRDSVYTDGVQYVAETAGAYWLINEIAFSQAIKGVAAEEFQVWRLHVDDAAAAWLYCENGNGKKVLEHRINLTDFPLSEITFFVRDNVIMLASEY